MREDLTKSSAGKKVYVKSMFDSIAGRYDFLNHFLSAGIDKLWRKKAIRIISEHKTSPSILDVATGTGDLAIAAMRLDPEYVTGIDISSAMLEIGKEKVRRLGLSGKIRLMHGDSESIPFPDNTFDVAMVAFGVRNFQDPVKGLTEMRRVLKSDGMVLVLEFSKPRSFVFSNIYRFYFTRILPFFGRVFSGNKNAYTYLPESVMNFPDNENFLELMSKSGLSTVKQRKLTGGIASIYTGFKSAGQ